ncbi:MAG: hypothetical protein AB4426_19245 [Xenococcaceae cyanobacterium]
MKLSSSLFKKIVQELEVCEDSIRVKKMIFCACKNSWETDLNVLNQFSLEHLIQELLQLNPSIDKLNSSLNQVVESLNRQEVYSAVANLIISKICKFYRDSEESTQIILIQPQTRHMKDFTLKKIASNLKQHQEAARIKKLIFSTCKNRWENNPKTIGDYDLKDLILELGQLNSTREELKTALYNVVATLNRQNLYSLIAEIILSELNILYEEENREDETQSLTPQRIQGNNRVNIPNNYSKHQQQNILPNLNAKVNLAANQSANEPQKSQQKQQSKSYDLFDWRLEVMKYTNPLRAKILLFSVIYHKWDSSGQDWSMLKSYTLDDLLLRLLRNYKTITELESKLYATAKSLVEPDENLQTANAIIESIKPFYNRN